MSIFYQQILPAAHVREMARRERIQEYFRVAAAPLYKLKAEILGFSPSPVLDPKHQAMIEQIDKNIELCRELAIKEADAYFFHEPRSH